MRARQAVCTKQQGHAGLNPALGAAKGRNRSRIEREAQRQCAAPRRVAFKLACKIQIHGFERPPRQGQAAHIYPKIALRLSGIARKTGRGSHRARRQGRHKHPPRRKLQLLQRKAHIKFFRTKLCLCPQMSRRLHGHIQTAQANLILAHAVCAVAQRGPGCRPQAKLLRGQVEIQPPQLKYAGLPAHSAVRRRKAACIKDCFQRPVYRALCTQLGSKPFVPAAQPAKIKTCRNLPCAKGIGQPCLALQPVNLHSRGAAIPVQKPGHTPAHYCLLGRLLSMSRYG